MTSAPRLPASLAYLRKPLRALERIDPDSIDECTDTTLICLALQERISILDKDSALTALEADKSTLAAWLSAQPEHPGHFLVAFMQIGPEFVDYLRAFKAIPTEESKKVRKPKLKMDVPDGFTAEKISGMLLMRNEPANRATWGDNACALSVHAMTSIEAAKFQQYLESHPEAERCGAVAYGVAIGSKYRYLNKTWYCLQIGEHHIQVIVERAHKAPSATLLAFEPLVENCLPSLRAS